MISLRDKTTLQVLTANVFVRFGNSGNRNQFVTFPFRMEKIIVIANQIYFGKVKRFAPDSVPDLTDDVKTNRNRSHCQERRLLLCLVFLFLSLSLFNISFSP